MSQITIKSHLFPNKNCVVFVFDEGDYGTIGKVQSFLVFFLEYNEGPYHDDGEEDHHFMIFDGAHFPLNKFEEATLFFQLTVNYYKNKFDETIDKKEKNKNDEELLTARNDITSYSLEEIKELNEIKFKDKNFFKMVDKIDSIISH